MVRYHAASRSLVAATHGRGIYRLTLPSGPLANLSAASFSGVELASEQIVAVFGAGLATGQQPAPFPLPTSLLGTRVLVRDSAGVERLAPLFYVGPDQVNYLVPSGTARGPATVTITSGERAVSVGTVQVAAVAPGLFAANSNGKEAAAANAIRVKPGNVQSAVQVAQFDAAQGKVVTVPIDLGPPEDQVFLVLFGTGIRGHSSNPNNPTTVTATIGGASAPVSFAGAQCCLIGLDQANVLIPRSLAGQGEVDVVLTVEGKMTNTVKIRIK
jgi:uncharacterized protein (TIGR03437 family)